MMRRTLLVVLATAALFPLNVLLIRSLAGSWFWPSLLPEQVDLAVWRAVADGGATGRRMLRAGVNSTVIAVSVGGLAAGLGFPIGRALARLSGWRRHLGAAAAFLPVAAPPIALAVGLQYSFLRLGLGGDPAGVLLAHVVPALGYTSLFFIGVFTLFDERVEDEARTLGASRWQTLARVTIPLLRRPLVEAWVLGFLVSWAQVPLTLVIGQGLVPTLAIEVLAYAEAGQDGIAAAGAVLLVAPPLLVLALASVAVGRARVAV